MQVVGQHGRCLHFLMATGARVSNAYPTCPSLRHSPSKDGLMRDAVRKMHINLTKDLRVGEGWGCVRLA